MLKMFSLSAELGNLWCQEKTRTSTTVKGHRHLKPMQAGRVEFSSATILLRTPHLFFPLNDLETQVNHNKMTDNSPDPIMSMFYWPGFGRLDGLSKKGVSNVLSLYPSLRDKEDDIS